MWVEVETVKGVVVFGRFGFYLFMYVKTGYEFFFVNFTVENWRHFLLLKAFLSYSGGMMSDDLADVFFL